MPYPKFSTNRRLACIEVCPLKNLFIAVTFFLLIGCGKRDLAQNVSEADFVTGSSRDAVVTQLDQIRAKKLKDSPELIRAELNVKGMNHPMQVELSFADGKLNGVAYFPQ